MGKEKVRPAPATGLRRRAEDRLQKRATAGPQPEPNGGQRLLHELQVHQVELELQNEELRDAQTRLSAMLARYTDLYDFAPVGFLTVDPHGTILELNLAAAELLGAGRSQLLHRRLERRFAAADKPALRVLLARLHSGPGKQVLEVELAASAAGQRFMRIEGIAVDVAAGGVAGACLLALLDISESRRLQAELQQHMEELQEAFDHIRKLQGILPICSYCHRIRDEQEVWQQLEEYISSHSATQFSHGICAACMAEHFPGMADPAVKTP